MEEKRGSGRAKLSCIGRDIEYRELTLERNGENVWELVSDSRTQPELLGDRIVYLLSELMRDRTNLSALPQSCLNGSTLWVWSVSRPRKYPGRFCKTLTH